MAVEPKTDAELAERLRVLYAASEHSGGARDDFWDTVNLHIGWIVDLVMRAAKKNKMRKLNPINGGTARAAKLSPERRTEIAKTAAEARWLSR